MASGNATTTYPISSVGPWPEKATFNHVKLYSTEARWAKVTNFHSSGHSSVEWNRNKTLPRMFSRTAVTQALIQRASSSLTLLQLRRGAVNAVTDWGGVALERLWVWLGHMCLMSCRPCALDWTVELSSVVEELSCVGEIGGGSGD